VRTRTLGNSGIEASVVGLGTWAIGGWMWGGTEEKEAVEAIEAAIDAGVTLIDTAPIYGFGRSEELVGKAIAGKRDKVVLATKCGLVWDRKDGEFFFDATSTGQAEPNDPNARDVYKFLGPASIRDEVEASLKRLRVETIDLYQTHWQEDTTPVADAMAALLKLKDEGKIRAIGVSNATPDKLQTYLEHGAVATAQENFSMIDRQIEDDLLPVCRERNVSILAYSPLALGLLTGKITTDRTYGDGDLRDGRERFAAENLRRVQAMLASFRDIAADRGVTLAQLAIAWTVAQPGVTFALCGARRRDHALENAAAGDLQLNSAELASMDGAIDAYLAEVGRSE
jgi:methylglyoxal reductase